MNTKIDFMKVVEPVIEWLNENGDPHTTIIITQTDAEVVQGILAHITDKYVKD